MNIRNIFIVMCGLLLTAQTMKAQENMYVLGSNGAVNAIQTSQVDYSTFNADDSWFTIINDGLDGTRNNLISASCTVALATDGAVKTLGVTPEIGVCYSKNNTIPTTKDDCQTLGSKMGSYTFTLSSLTSGTTYYYRVYVKLGDEVIYGDICNAKTLGTTPNDKTINGHKFIDLGLPSGLLWAETNIGAKEVAYYGNYYAWGEITAKSHYDWDTYKYGTSENGLTKYCLQQAVFEEDDNYINLEKEDDVAYMNWGTPCRMPTKDEFSELLNTDNCTWTWTSMSPSKVSSSNGYKVNGYKVVSKKNGNSLFLPASGFHSVNTTLGTISNGYYWSSTLSFRASSTAYYLSFSNDNTDLNIDGDFDRCYGLTVRPVAEP